jgi:hypothetical protein
MQKSHGSKGANHRGARPQAANRLYISALAFTRFTRLWARACSLHYGRISTMKQIALLLFAVVTALSLAPASARAQSQTMGQLRFSSSSKAIGDSGVWIDGQYAGYVKELKGDNKISLLPGDHEIIVRQAGYKDFTQKIVVAPQQVQNVAVTMEKDPRAVYPTGRNSAELKLNIAPERAAVFVDDGYIGHAADFGGYHIMVVSPGKHRVRVELPGYQTFETEVNPLPGQRTEIKTGLIKGGGEDSGTLVNVKQQR